MYLRCPDCDALTWLKSLEPGRAALSVDCGNCDRELSLITAGELGATDDEQNQRALAYAEYHRIDVPSAYSVLLGNMALQDALDTREARAAEGRTTASPEVIAEMAGDDDDAETEEEGGFDPGFESAVAEGFLTAEEALERGDRKSLATYLAGLHRIPLRLAFKVADNRITLAEATLIVAQNPELAPDLPRTPATRRERVLAWTLGVLLLAAIGIQAAHIWHRASQPPFPRGQLSMQRAAAPREISEAEPRRRAVADLTTGDDGALLRIEAPDPSSVLRSFCDSGPRECEPVELAPARPPFPGTRIGVFRDLDRLNSRFAIRIFKDRETSRWVAGDGVQPIPTMPEPDYLKDVDRVPVRAIQDEVKPLRDS